MSRNLFIRISLTVFLFLFSVQHVSGSGGGFANVGPLLGEPYADTGLRELVSLEKKGNLLIGKPRYSSINLVTMYAPEANGNHFILREIDSPEGEKTVLLTAPNSLREKMRRITLFVKSENASTTLYEYINDTWIPRQPQFLKDLAIQDNNFMKQSLVAYSVNDFGLYWIPTEESLKKLNNFSTPLDTSAKGLLGGYLSHGFLPWAGAFVFLILGWSISRWSFSKEIRSGK